MINKATSLFYDAERMLDWWETEQTVAVVLKTLEPREQKMIYLRFWEDENCRVIGERFGLSASRVHQIIKMVLRKLRHPRVTKHLIGCPHKRSKYA